MKKIFSIFLILSLTIMGGYVYSNNTTSKISNNPKVESRLSVKLKDKKCKKQDSSLYYDSNNKRCIKEVEKESIKSSTFEHYKCAKDGVWLKIDISNTAIKGKYNRNNQYNIGDTVSINKGLPDSKKCGTISKSLKYNIYQCQMHNTREYIESTDNKLVDEGPYVFTYNSNNKYGYVQYIQIESSKKPTNESCSIFFIYHCNQGRWERGIASVEVPINKGILGEYVEGNSYNSGDMVYAKRNTIPNLGCPNPSSNYSGETKNYSDVSVQSILLLDINSSSMVLKNATDFNIYLDKLGVGSSSFYPKHLKDAIGYSSRPGVYFIDEIIIPSGKTISIPHNAPVLSFFYQTDSNGGGFSTKNLCVPSFIEGEDNSYESKKGTIYCSYTNYKSESSTAYYNKSVTLSERNDLISTSYKRASLEYPLIPMGRYFSK